MKFDVNFVLVTQLKSRRSQQKREREREEEEYVRVQRPKMHVKVGGKKKGARGRGQVLGVKKMETKRESGAAYTAH